MAVLLAGLPTSVPGTTINRLCGSSLDAAMQASRAVEAGDASLHARRRRRVDVARAVGPAQAREGRSPVGDETLHSTTLGWRMVNPRDAGPVDDLARREHGEARRASTGSTRERAGRVRAAQPPRSPRRRGTPASTTTGSSRCRSTDLARDENVRPDTSLEKLAQAQAGVRRATARSPPATLAAQRRRGRAADRRRGRRRQLGLEPLARIAGRGAHAVDPDVFGIAPGRGGRARRSRGRASAGATCARSSSTRRSRRSRSPAWRSGRSSTPRSST